MGAEPGTAVSVLVPIYNTEAYLRQCLDALCRQTLRNIEIICINDGSTDSSSAILQEYRAQDDRIHVIDKSNSGYGASMNVGIEHARGEYIGIVEPDDFPEESMFKVLYRNALKHGCDLVKSNFFEYVGGRDQINKNLDAFPYKKPFDPIEKPNVICTIPSVWTGLYKRQMLLDQNIRFRETPGASFQDTSFVLKAWFASKRCVLLRKALLHYRMDNPGSSVKTADKVFTVCDELAESERFLRALPDRTQAFIPWFNVDKLGKYRWNYERIAPDQHEAFAERMREEFSAARAAGELVEAFFSPPDWAVLTELLSVDAASFARSYPEVF